MMACCSARRGVIDPRGRRETHPDGDASGCREGEAEQPRCARGEGSRRSRKRAAERPRGENLVRDDRHEDAQAILAAADAEDEAGDEGVHGEREEEDPRPDERQRGGAASSRRRLDGSRCMHSLSLLPGIARRHHRHDPGHRHPARSRLTRRRGASGYLDHHRRRLRRLVEESQRADQRVCARPRSHERHAIGIGVGAGCAAPGCSGEQLRPRREDRSDRVDAEREEDPTAAVQLGVGVPVDIVELPCRVSEQVQEARAQKDATAKDCAEPDGAINPWAAETVPHHQRCAAANGGADENDRGVGDAVHIHVLWAVSQSITTHVHTPSWADAL
mmetsp:Transcript_33596/g.105804  ORF Transcript_33596/g.105804 Transcript_33596/m.105804 type:complete len:332 (-) Transcript_33596:11-1006(-)